jgi:hypothetical protein
MFANVLLLYKPQIPSIIHQGLVCTDHKAKNPSSKVLVFIGFPSNPEKNEKKGDREMSHFRVETTAE